MADEDGQFGVGKKNPSSLFFSLSCLCQMVAVITLFFFPKLLWLAFHPLDDDFCVAVPAQMKHDIKNDDPLLLLPFPFPICGIKQFYFCSYST